MKLSNEELDSILAEAGLELAQPYDENGKYLKGQYLFTRCTTCGTQTHYRLKLIVANQTESKLLAELRDTLLPKFMSGEIDVSSVTI